MSGDLVKSSHMNFWASPRLSRQWLVRIVNHAQLLIRGVSRFSTNIRSVSQVLTDALLSTTVYFSAVTRARGKSHTAPDTGVSEFSTNMTSVSTTLTDASLNTTESFFLTCARPNTGCVGILRPPVTLQMSGELGKFSHMHLWVPPSLFRQRLMRVVNHALLLIQGVSRYSTNIRSVR